MRRRALTGAILALTAAGPLLAAPGEANPLTETTHIVKPGETLGGIANRAGVAQVLIVEANALPPPYPIKAGQKLKIPRRRTHTVKAGETGFSIAMDYGVPWATIAAANGLAPKAAAKPGQVLTIPMLIAAKLPSPVVPAKAPVIPADTPLKEAAPKAVAAKAGSPTALLPPAPAQTAAIPAKTARPVTSPIRTAQQTASSQIAAGPTGTPQAQTPPPVRQLAVAGTGAAKPAIQTPTAATKPASTAGSATPKLALQDTLAPRMIWPLRGELRRNFAPRGDSGGRPYHDGIDIAAAQGAPVRAAAEGKVIFAGQGPKEYGLTVIIYHSGRWTTTYASLDRVSVKDGDKVRKGQQIGLTGQTGMAIGPQLHFEVRRNRLALDPVGYLPELPAAGF